MEELKKRKTPRHQEFDYNSVGVYFLTICTQNHKPILSRIVGYCVLDCPSIAGDFERPEIKLTRYGKIADKYIKQLNEFYDHLSVESYVIMPNHIHILLWVKDNKSEIYSGQSRTPVPTTAKNVPTNTERVPTNTERANSVCSKFVSTFKRFCNKEYGENIWQARFNDHVIRNSEDYEKHVQYIYDNPIRWCFDEMYTEE